MPHTEVIVTAMRDPAGKTLDKFPTLQVLAVFDCTVGGAEILNVPFVRDLDRGTTRAFLTRRHSVVDPGVRIGIEKAARRAYREFQQGAPS
ncbi:hypothetical protein [Bosea sp. PAMC 26642]|uniref:hypothetical protein n=1 Tax=Bosea sp. (strain PAMC 26642) TaxID=1792307 RepID=UPI00076FE5B1|nr:hypothetical protein [Bosea sp. PAMC 26642]AMJ59366.1 hypothetical protein AXW83_02760 [Bosea sp. PAMC 26642]